MQKTKILTTTEEIKIISDPFRYRILSYFDKINAPATVKQVADNMEESPAKIYYHVKKMEKVDILRLIYTKEINGIIAKYYEPTAENFEIQLANDSSNDDYAKFNENNSKIMKTELGKMFLQFYDAGKQEMLDNLNYSIKQNKKSKFTLSMKDLYMTDDEAKKFINYITKFIDDHKNLKKDCNNINRYTLFFNIMQTLNIKSKNK